MFYNVYSGVQVGVSVSQFAAHVIFSNVCHDNVEDLRNKQGYLSFVLFMLQRLQKLSWNGNLPRAELTVHSVYEQTKIKPIRATIELKAYQSLFIPCTTAMQSQLEIIKFGSSTD